VRLTAAGEAALPYAKAALAAVADINVASMSSPNWCAAVSRSATVTSHNVDMPSLLADFHAEHPNVEITLSTESSDVLIDKVRTGRLDAAIVSVGPDERPEPRSGVATDEAIVAAVCITDELASRKTVRLTDLADRRLIALPVGAGIRHQLDAACASAGVTPHIAFEASAPLALADLAERGLGVAIVPASVPRSRAGLHALTIVPRLRGRLALACGRTPDEPRRAVLVDKARRLLRVGGRA